MKLNLIELAQKYKDFVVKEFVGCSINSLKNDFLYYLWIKENINKNLWSLPLLIVLARKELYFPLSSLSLELYSVWLCMDSPLINGN